MEESASGVIGRVHHASPESSTSRSRSVVRYRPYVDGLRGIAVGAVVLYHFFPRYARGGFVGVDIFFVISGFLISGIILDAVATGGFSYVAFYQRRIKRIFPPLTLLLAVTLIVGWLTLFEDEFSQLGKHVGAGAAFVSNFILLREGGYFDIAVERKPLLHLWSLAIEEQFYLVWPVALVWASKRRRTPLLIAALAAVSFAANLWLVRSRPSDAFYISLPRFWELMLGSALAYLAFARGTDVDRMLPERSLGALAILGVALIAFAVLRFDAGAPYPGWQALVPTVGTALIIITGDGAWSNRALLSSRPLVALGLISYSLYLWHWVLLFFARTIGNAEPGAAAKWLLIVAAVAMATLSLRYLERPIRRSPARGNATRVLCAAMVVLIGVGFAAYRMMIPTPIPEVWQQIARARFDRYPPRSWDPSHRMRPYYIGDSSRAEILFFGDSHMAQYYPRVARLVEDSVTVERNVAFATASGCPMLPGVERVDADVELECAKFFRQTIDYAKQRKFAKIVLTAYWDGYFAGLNTTVGRKGPLLYGVNDPTRTPIAPGTSAFRAAFRALEEELSGFIQSGTRVYILLPNPSSLVLNPTEVLAQYNRLRFGAQPLPRETTMDRREFERRTAAVNGALREMASRDGVVLIDPVPYLCESQTTCGNLKDGRAIYTNDSHLTGQYVRDYATYIDSVFDFRRMQ